MRFLCLHGQGTNSKVFQVQTAALRHELGPEHSFDFVQGSVSCDMAKEIYEFSSADEAYYQYYHHDARSYMLVFELLDEYIQSHGPFDGIFAFSQGAGIALMYLIRHTHLHPGQPLPFRLAVLFSRIGVSDIGYWLQTGKAVPLSRMPAGLDKLKLPVAAIWGENDWDRVKLEADTTEELVCKEFVWSFVHSGGHEIPSLRIQGSIAGASRVIRRAISQALIK